MKTTILCCSIVAVIMLAPAPVRACGGEGQRACCWFCCGEYSNQGYGYGCDEGLVETGPGSCVAIHGSYYCGCSIGICVRPTPCGGEGERACCWALLYEHASPAGPCDAGLTEGGSCIDTLGIAGTCGLWDCSIGVCTDSNACGGNGEWACNLLFCDPWHTMELVPPLLFHCRTCGGGGQPVCLNFEENTLGCKSGFTPDPSTLFTTCIACGGEGQFMCLNLMDPPCDEPWLRLPWSWPWDAGFAWPWEDAFTWPWEDAFTWPWEQGWLWPWEAALHLVTCQKAWEPIAEPDCDVFNEYGHLDCDAEEQPEGAPVFGIADTHAHPFSNLAFGGALLWGSPFDERGTVDEPGINYALAWGDYTWDFPTTWTGDSVADHLRDLLVQELPGLEYLLPDALELPTLPTPNGYMIHAAPMAVVMSVLNGEGFLHSPSGPADFQNWPNWDSTMHQQQYYKWMQRAYKGGLRLMVMLAVNNEVSCNLSLSVHKDYGCNDMDAVDRQLQATEDLETFIDNQYGGAGEGWFRIVKTPEEARAAIRSGKMAVVLGIEVDALFDCYPDNPACTETHIRNELVRYYNQGVRHVFPLHLHDNAFGGAALYHWLWPWANAIATGNLMVLEPCREHPTGPHQYDYVPIPFEEAGDPPSSFPQFVQFVIDELKNLAGVVFPDVPAFPDVTAWCNARGLQQSKGDFLIREMMAQKFIIDVDHMSLPTLDTVLDMAEDNDDYPLISGHSFLFDKPLTEFGTEGSRTENHRTSAQISRISKLGGIVSPLPPRKEGSSTHDYVKMYEYVKAQMAGGPYGDDHPGIAFGSDWGAMFLMTAPRCPNYDPNDPDPGPEDCNEFHNERRAPLSYPFTIEGIPGQFHRQRTGTKDFDFNKHGLAHIGLFPDFIADVKIAGEGGWDELCSQAALEDQNCSCGGGGGCGDPMTGDCCEANGTPYCFDAECCRSVCDSMPYCCDQGWDELCSQAAAEAVAAIR